MGDWHQEQIDTVTDFILEREKQLVESLKPFVEELDIHTEATGESYEDEDLWNNSLGKYLFIKASQALKSLGYRGKK